MSSLKNTRNLPPRAGALIESLRGLGYSTASALADIIDNSITANSSTIKINFNWDKNKSTITILDNGIGMAEHELEKAMRLGETSPLDAREKSDLGRFGLGLKTASFSQCRRLTVASKKNGSLSCFRWDLDFLAQNNDGWYLLEGFEIESEINQELLNVQESGTLVLWEVMDRIITKGYSDQDFLCLIDKVENHISMVFHRFIEGSGAPLLLLINNRPVKPWDPFCRNHSATWSSPIENLLTEDGKVEVQCYILPHKDKLSDKEYDYFAGQAGWVAQQGFYIYRNERLLVSGSWLGLGNRRCWTKEDSFKLARIRLDISNNSDTSWKIDIRKSVARPPVTLCDKLAHLAEDTRARARNVYANRGIYLPSVSRDTISQAWKIQKTAAGIKYKIDTCHPIIQTVINSSGELKPSILSMIRIIEETIPVQQIWLDTSEAQDSSIINFSGVNQTEVEELLLIMYKSMLKQKGYSGASAKKMLLKSEPFNNFPDLVNNLPDDINEGVKL